jgi:2-polyprenyl-3-methyl-5-hydroxy-6-metoxy-1,4-benzoquinol methylase
MMYYVKSVVKWLLSRFGFRISMISPPQGSFEVLDEFEDSSENRFKRLKGYRDNIWSTDWQAMNEARAKPDVQTVKKMDSVTGSRNLVAKMEKLLQIHSLSLLGKDVLDVGCFSGASTYALAEHGARYVDDSRRT